MRTQSTKFFQATKRQEHEIDAAGKIVGRLASQIAIILQGKNKPTYTPNADLGDIVKIKNIGQMSATGKKMNEKVIRNYSGYPGGLIERKWQDLMKTDPARVLEHAVLRMLPKNRLAKEMIKRLIIVK